MKPVCKRCGKCCTIKNFDGNWIKCPYLLVYKRGFTKCQIYPDRIDASLGGGYFCGYRSETIYDFPDCPYNTTKPIHPHYKK